MDIRRLFQPSPKNIDMSLYWGNLTDPREHDPNNFRYLGHALNVDGSTWTFMERKAVERGIGYVAGQAIDLSEKPSHITKAVTKSTSLIDREHSSTWSNAGLILGIPPEDILITAPLDAGAIHGSREKTVKPLRERHPTLLRPEELLARSVAYTHNEVVVATGNAAVIGFFTKINPYSGRIVAPNLTARLAHHAKRMRAPLITLPVSDR